MNPCPYVCDNKSYSGWCNSTVCINPKYNGRNRIEYATEHVVVENCPICGRPFVENVVCIEQEAERSKNND